MGSPSTPLYTVYTTPLRFPFNEASLGLVKLIEGDGGRVGILIL